MNTTAHGIIWQQQNLIYTTIPLKKYCLMISGRRIFSSLTVLNVVLNVLEQNYLTWSTQLNGNRKKIMSWTYKGDPITELPNDCEGFVYLITNLTNNKKYVGKKLAKFKTSKPPLKGRKNRRRSKVESDWREYWGSNDHLKADVQHLGEDKFTREILYFCNSRGLMSYLEAKEQFDRRVLESDEYYNGIINVRVGSSKILQEALKKFDE